MQATFKRQRSPPEAPTGIQCRAFAKINNAEEDFASSDFVWSILAEIDNHICVSGRGDQAASNSAGCGSIPQTRANGMNANWKAASLLKRCPQGLKDRTLLIPNGDDLNIVEDPRLKRAARKGCRCKSMPSPPILISTVDEV